MRVISYEPKLAKHLQTRRVRLARMILIQAIRNAVVNDLVVRNAADLAAVPTGEAGRPSRTLTMEQALAVPHAAKGERLWPSVAVSKLGGIRTEEARALRWSEVDLGCVPTPAPPGFANRCHCAGPAVS
jgi:integrase